MTKKSFIEATQYKHNQVIDFNGLHIGIVGWLNNPWMIVNTTNFDEITDRQYEPIASFHTREELWQHIKAQA